MNTHQERILAKLISAPRQSFNQLWSKEGTSNSFAYHLKELEKLGFVHKTGDVYELTHAGKREAAYLSGVTGKKVRAPLLGLLVVVIHDGKVLMQERLKEPFYGYWGFIGGKLEFDQYLLEGAAAELLEETGLTCDLQLKGLFSSKTYNNGELAYNHQMFIVLGTNPKGKLVTEMREGRNDWILLEEVRTLKAFPNALHSLQIAQRERFRWVEGDRFQEDDVFTRQNDLRNELI